MFDGCSHIRGVIRDDEVKLREAVPNPLSVLVIRQCSDVRSDRVTAPRKHPWMIYAELQSADKPLCLQPEQAICDLGSVGESEFTA